jgi:hypothetical protein
MHADHVLQNRWENLSVKKRNGFKRIAGKIDLKNKKTLLMTKYTIHTSGLIFHRKSVHEITNNGQTTSLADGSKSMIYCRYHCRHAGENQEGAPERTGLVLY